MNADEDGVSEVGALARLGLKLAFGERGVHLAEYLDDRRIRRSSARIEKLGDWAMEDGVDTNDILELVAEDDEAAEVVESIVQIAARSRYEPKLRYLAKCLSNFVKGNAGASPDITFAKVAAVAELDAVHVQAMHGIRAAQTAAARRTRQPERVNPATVFVSRSDIEGTRRESPLQTVFDPVIATLLRTGLVESETDVDVDVQINLDVKGEAAEAIPFASTTITYRMTPLGHEVLAALEGDLHSQFDVPS